MLLYYLSMVETPEDKNKVEALYYKYRTLMKYIALKMLKDEELAEDAVSDAFVSLIGSIDRIGDVNADDTKAFVYTVTRNMSLNVFNKAKRQASVMIENDTEYQINNTDVFEDVYLNEWFKQINDLPLIYRDVLQLKVYYGMSTQEIANVLHISKDLVRKRLERARAILKESMEKGEIHV